ncbi:Uridine diphosphate glucose pyrophosphatase NUDT14 [Fragariocoptes setiger]|uniref:XK-related protein n=1 Tax=Fragariocoptes setiger TaxID=1670756 RepID=A0ABQ7SAN3_9ACAR|nr:Uridine diphosphate glucose pyrophosphatase NUDT14 [Fragariocoptes setiger]
MMARKWPLRLALLWSIASLVSSSPPIDYLLFNSETSSSDQQPHLKHLTSIFGPEVDVPRTTINSSDETSLNWQIARLLTNSSHRHDSNNVDLKISLKAWQIMQQQAMAYAEHKVKAFRPIINDLMQEANVSEPCNRAINDWLTHLAKFDRWAFNMWNAWGQFPSSGLLEGSFTDLGSYRGCLSVEHHASIGEPQYCTLDFQPIVPKRPPFHNIFARIIELNATNSRQNNNISSTTITPLHELSLRAQYFYYVKFRIGSCFPIKCSLQDIQQMTTSAAQRGILQATHVECQKREVVTLNTYQIVAIGILTSYVTYTLTRGDKRRFNKFAFAISRYIRLTPQLGIVILCFFLLPLLGDGPVYKHVTGDKAANCYKHWWVDLLYIQSFYSNDMLTQGWLCCAIGLITVAWGPYYWNLGAPYTQWQSTIYYNVCQIIWPMSISWIIYACATGRGGPINKILSARVFVPFGRITYMTYLSHALVVYHSSANISIQTEPTLLIFATLVVGQSMGGFGWPFPHAPFNVRPPSSFLSPFQPFSMINRQPRPTIDTPDIPSYLPPTSNIVRRPPATANPPYVVARRRPSPAQTWRWALARRNQWRPRTTIAPERLTTTSMNVTTPSLATVGSNNNQTTTATMIIKTSTAAPVRQVAQFLPICDLMFNLISMIAYFCDSTFNLIALFILYTNPHTQQWAYVGFVSMSLSSFLCQIVSLRWSLKAHFDNYKNQIDANTQAALAEDELIEKSSRHGAFHAPNSVVHVRSHSYGGGPYQTNGMHHSQHQSLHHQATSYPSAYQQPFTTHHFHQHSASTGVGDSSEFLPASTNTSSSMGPHRHSEASTRIRSNYYLSIFFESIVHCLQCGLLLRYIRLVIPIVDHSRVKRDARDLCILRMIHAFCQSAPLLLIQLYIIWSRTSPEQLQPSSVTSAGLSLFSICWALASFTKYSRTKYLHNFVLTWPGVISQLLWRFGTVSSRVVALTFYAVHYGYWIILALALHWASMFLWLLLPGNLLRDDDNVKRPKKLAIAIITAWVYCFCYINFEKHNSKQKMFLFYLLMFLENNLLLSVCLGFSPYLSWTRSISVLTVYLGFLIGITFMMIYYRQFHVNVINADLSASDDSLDSIADHLTPAGKKIIGYKPGTMSVTHHVRDPIVNNHSPPPPQQQSHQLQPQQQHYYANNLPTMSSTNKLPGVFSCRLNSAFGKIGPRVHSVRFINQGDSKYVRPMRMHFTLNDKTRTWDCLKAHDSVSCVIYNKTRQRLIYVKQFRPAVYLASLTSTSELDEIHVDQLPKPKDSRTGYTIELCAGLADKKGKTSQQTMQEEIWEETGYKVPLESVKFVASFRGSTGLSGTLMDLFFCEVTDDQRESQGGGVDDEAIEVLELTIEEAERNLYCSDHEASYSRPPAMLFGTSWFINKYMAVKR